MKISLSGDQIRKQFLYPLVNLGIINMVKSVINRNENLCSPVEDSIFSLFDEDDYRLKISDYRLYPSKNVIEEEFRTIVKHDAREGVDKKYILMDTDGTEITVNQLLDKYFNNPESCFV